jgi:hypothetical protein
VVFFTNQPPNIYGFIFGLGLMGVNAALLAFMTKRLLSSSGGSSKVLASPLFLGMLPVKFGLLGFGSYLAIVTFNLNPWFFVGGAAASLAFVSVALSKNIRTSEAPSGKI